MFFNFFLGSMAPLDNFFNLMCGGKYYRGYFVLTNLNLLCFWIFPKISNLKRPNLIKLLGLMAPL